MYGWGRPEDTGKTAPVLILGSPSTGFGSDRDSLPWTAQYTLRMHPNKNGPVKVPIKRFSCVREAKPNRTMFVHTGGEFFEFASEGGPNTGK
jgi:hypothetical protein